MTYIQLFITLWHLMLLHTVKSTNQQPILYSSYNFNLNNLSQWSITEYSNATQQITACTIQIASLCVQFTYPTTQTFHILYKDISFNFLQTNITTSISTPPTTHVSTNTRRRLRSRCPNILYKRKARTRPRRRHLVKRINFADNMIISLDIRVNRFPRAGWGNVFHCGKSDQIRQPGIWINKHSKRFHVSYSTKRNANPHRNSRFKIRRGKKYSIMFKIRRTRYDVYVNGRRWYSVNGRHHNHRNQPCWLSNPWYEAANVYVSNLKIIKGTNPNPRCRKRRKRRRRKRRRRKKRRRRRVDHTLRRAYKRMYRLGKKIGKVFKKAKKAKKSKCGQSKCGMRPMAINVGPVYPKMGGFIVGMNRRRLITDMNMRLKKCVWMKESHVMHEICMIYYYVDDSVAMQYNTISMINGDDVINYDGYMEEYVMRMNGIGCNDELVDIIGYIICVENGLHVVLKENINGKMILGYGGDDGWDKIYQLNDMNDLKCKYMETLEICVHIISDNELDLIVKKAVDYKEHMRMIGKEY